MAVIPPKIQVILLPGPPGIPGPGYNPIEFTLDNVSSYSAMHPFSYTPQITLLNQYGEEVETDVTVSPGEVDLSFPGPFTGKLTLA